MEENKFSLPGLDYFEWKNIFTGSVGNSFRYRIFPEGDQMKAFVWHKDICFEKCEVEAQKDFTLDQAGYDELYQWLYEQYKR